MLLLLCSRDMYFIMTHAQRAGDLTFSICKMHAKCYIMLTYYIHSERILSTLSSQSDSPLNGK
jgi:hypothetical protein